MANSPTEVGPTAFYQLMYADCYVRNECRERCAGHVVRPSWVTGPGRFLGLGLNCAGDLQATVEKAIDYFRMHAQQFEVVYPQADPTVDWEKVAGR